MSEGILYEPRSFWSIQTQTPSITEVERVLLPKRHFFNGERWPIQINRLAVLGVNYSFVEATAAPNQASSVINRVRIAIAAPQRYHLNSKRFALTADISPRPTWMPQVGLVGADEPSSLWGQSMLKFDRPVRIPRMGSIEWSLSAMTNNVNASTNPVATMLYQEAGGSIWPGQARTFEATLRALQGPFIQPNSEERWPFVDTEGILGSLGFNTRNWWPPETHFNAQIFDRQESTRDGSTELTDMRVFIDQREYDEEIFNTAKPNAVSTKIGSRVRTTNGGSNTWWWRPGAPLALTFDHITPANVYWLKDPITLGPGDQLDVELEFPQVPSTENDMQVGVSLNGFAAIEG